LNDNINVKDNIDVKQIKYSSNKNNDDIPFDYNMYLEKKKRGNSNTNNNINSSANKDFRNKSTTKSGIFEKLYNDAFKKQDEKLLNDEIKKLSELEECTFQPKINKKGLN
jgi:hypothetical protein